MLITQLINTVMIKKKWILLAFILLSGQLSHMSVAMAGTKGDFLQAREAFKRNDLAVVNQAITQFTPDHPLYAYLQYWQLTLQLKQDHLSFARVKEYQTAYPESLLAERLLIDWLKNQANKHNWQVVKEAYKEPRNPDTELSCAYFNARYQTGEADSAFSGKTLFFVDSDLSDQCQDYFTTLVKNNYLNHDEIWQRIRLSLENSSIKTATKISSTFLGTAGFTDHFLAEITRAPEQYIQQCLDNKKRCIESRPYEEGLIYALARIARRAPQKAVDYWLRFELIFPEVERGYVWGQLAYQAAKQQHPKALDWYYIAPPELLSDEQLEWRVRAALRQQDWRAVLLSIQCLSITDQNEPAWRYWQARAWIEQDENLDVAEQQLEKLAQEYHFYGQLASEELAELHDRSPKKAGKQPLPHDTKVDIEEMNAMKQNPSIQRALALNEFDLPGEGTKEWLWGSREFDDHKLLAASQIAYELNWYERAINTAARTKKVHNFTLRYPTPYRSILKNYTAYYEIDEAWVAGLIRQESRFSALTKSSAGAMGLMQIMPATAKQIANELELFDYRTNQLYKPNMNVLFGVYYLRQLWDNFELSKVLATAGYNAGPGRARQWQNNVPKDGLEGAIFIETIPFNETRNYVKFVLSNHLYYAARLGIYKQSLKQILGTVKPH